MNFPNIEIPMVFYFLLPLVNVSNYYYRLLDLVLSGRRGLDAQDFDNPILMRMMPKAIMVAILANIYSLLHLSFYICFMIKSNLLSAIILSIISIVISMVISMVIISLIEGNFPKDTTDFMSIYLVSRIARFVSPIVLAVIFYLLFFNLPSNIVR